MPTKPERENMPRISNISLNSRRVTFEEYRAACKKTVLVTCKACNKSYDQQTINKLLPALDFTDICLNCIKESSQQMKLSYLPDLKTAKSALLELTITYQAAHKLHKDLAAKYQKYDYIFNIIKHHQEKPVADIKLPKKKSKSTKQTGKAAALKILAELTPDQRAAILATLTKEQAL